MLVCNFFKKTCLSDSLGNALLSAKQDCNSGQHAHITSAAFPALLSTRTSTFVHSAVEMVSRKWLPMLMLFHESVEMVSEIVSFNSPMETQTQKINEQTSKTPHPLPNKLSEGTWKFNYLLRFLRSLVGVFGCQKAKHHKRRQTIIQIVCMITDDTC